MKDDTLYWLSCEHTGRTWSITTILVAATSITVYAGPRLLIWKEAQVDDPDTDNCGGYVSGFD